MASGSHVVSLAGSIPWVMLMAFLFAPRWRSPVGGRSANPRQQFPRQHIHPARPAKAGARRDHARERGTHRIAFAVVRFEVLDKRDIIRVCVALAMQEEDRNPGTLLLI